MRISAVVAMAQNHAIGLKGQLPWRLPEDLKRFKTLTWGAPIIMGRKTYESIGRILPGRQNILITRRADLEVPGAFVVSSLEEALRVCPKDCPEVFVIGGAEIYAMALPRVERIYLTWIKKEIEGDTFFPPIDSSVFHETECLEVTGGPEGLSYSFKTLDRVSA